MMFAGVMGLSSSTKQWMFGAAAAPDGPRHWGSLSRLFSGTFCQTRSISQKTFAKQVACKKHM